MFKIIEIKVLVFIPFKWRKLFECDNMFCVLYRNFKSVERKTTRRRKIYDLSWVKIMNTFKRSRFAIVSSVCIKSFNDVSNSAAQMSIISLILKYKYSKRPHSIFYFHILDNSFVRCYAFINGYFFITPFDIWMKFQTKRNEANVGFVDKL